MITKLDVQMFHHESWKAIYFRVKSRGHEAQKLPACFCTPVSAGLGLSVYSKRHITLVVTFCKITWSEELRDDIF